MPMQLPMPMWQQRAAESAALSAPVTGVRCVPVFRWQAGCSQITDDWVSEEVPIALEFNGISHAVMLATPCDLEDFALGFGLSEGIFTSAADLYGCEVSETGPGITVSMDVSASSFAKLKARRRTLVGRTGCGVCGTESLEHALRPVPRVATGLNVRCEAVVHAMQAMREAQRMNHLTGSMHAAAWCDVNGSLRVLREDVGCHNALDKLVGALAGAGLVASEGFLVVTSRASVEMVQKAAVAGVPLIAAISAPTKLAIDTAQAAGIGLLGLVREGNLVIYTHPHRVSTTR